MLSGDKLLHRRIYNHRHEQLKLYAVRQQCVHTCIIIIKSIRLRALYQLKRGTCSLHRNLIEI